MIPLTGKAVILAFALGAACFAGPYSRALNHPGSATDAPVPGFVGPHGIGRARLDTLTTDGNGDPIYQNPDNFINPLFFAWAETVADYQRSDLEVPFNDSSLALGPVTGDHFDVVALGELSAVALAAGNPPGNITIELPQLVRNLSGADFVVFENGGIAQSNYGGAGVGGIFAELAFIEVSNGGVTYKRFPASSLNPPLAALPQPLGTAYASMDATNVRNLAGKHVNAYGDSWGTPFDLSEVDLPQITHIRIVDIPGDGSFTDHSGNPVYDPWRTVGSGGFDLEAVGAISTLMTFEEWPQLALLAPEDRGPGADPDGDGLSNLLEYAFASVPWLPDAAAPKISLTAGHAAITFIRDERLTDLVYEVQASPSMAPNDWTTIATSAAGAPLQGANGLAPVISETSAQAIQSIGVIRQATVRDIVPLSSATRRFLRVKVTTVSVSIPIE